jgi:nicotinamidase-related amidase
MQNDFYFNTEWHVPLMGSIIPRIRVLAERFQNDALFTRFTNPKKGYAGRWNLCVQGTHGWQIVDELKPYAKKVYDKPTYSCLKCAPLLSDLERKGVVDLYFVGVETDACIYSSAADAFDLGFSVHVVEDAVTSSVKELHEAAIKLVRKQFGEHAVVNSSDIPG